MISTPSHRLSDRFIIFETDQSIAFHRRLAAYRIGPQAPMIKLFRTQYLLSCRRRPETRSSDFDRFISRVQTYPKVTPWSTQIYFNTLISMGVEWMGANWPITSAISKNFNEAIQKAKAMIYCIVHLQTSNGTNFIMTDKTVTISTPLGTYTVPMGEFEWVIHQELERRKSKNVKLK